MPDPTGRTVSSSEAAAIFNRSPYCTRWMLWQHRVNGLSIEAEEDDRILWGQLLQDDILDMTARKYRLDIRQNHNNEYIRRGPLGATLDGETHQPSTGKMIVEAKNIDYLRWRDTWTEDAASPHVEIQVQVAMHVAGAARGVIAALVGGNDLKFYEREPNPETIAQIVAEAADFLHSVERKIEPDPLGDPIELPMLAVLYPEAVATERIEDLEDEELALNVRMLAAAQEQRKFHEKTEQRLKAWLLAHSGNAGIVRCNGALVRIKKWEVPPGICAPHSEAKVIRKGSVNTRVEIAAVDDAFVKDVFMDPGRAAHAE